MKKTLAAIAAVAASAQASAVDFGIGVSAKSNDTWIYVPIEITERLRVEPSVRFSQYDSTAESQSRMFGGIVTDRTKIDADQLQVGVGVFGVLPIKDAVRVYYGVRAAYIDQETTIRQTSRLETPSFEDEISTTSETSADGYRVAPVLGFEYFFTDSFSLGGEAEWYYQEIDQEARNDGQVGLRVEESGNGTDTHLILRYRF